MNGPIPVDNAGEIAIFAALGVAMLCAVWRLVRGPTLPDRVVALDLMALLLMGFIVAYAVVTDSAALVDIGLVLALVAFLSTVAFAYYLEKSTLPPDGEEY
jgi:multicomponent Na+:H+ antiporter subunit F